MWRVEMAGEPSAAWAKATSAAGVAETAFAVFVVGVGVGGRFSSQRREVGERSPDKMCWPAW